MLMLFGGVYWSKCSEMETRSKGWEGKYSLCISSIMRPILGTLYHAGGSPRTTFRGRVSEPHVCGGGAVILGYLVEPGMLQGFFCGDPFVGITNEDSLKQIEKVLHERTSVVWDRFLKQKHLVRIGEGGRKEKIEKGGRGRERWQRSHIHPIVSYS